MDINTPTADLTKELLKLDPGFQFRENWNGAGYNPSSEIDETMLYWGHYEGNKNWGHVLSFHEYNPWVPEQDKLLGKLTGMAFVGDLLNDITKEGLDYSIESIPYTPELREFVCTVYQYNGCGRIPSGCGRGKTFEEAVVRSWIHWRTWWNYKQEMEVKTA